MNLWKIDGKELKEVGQTRLDSENKLEEWIAKNQTLLGGDFLIFGKQVTTEYGGRIDLLALNRQGNVVIIELKRDKTPREVVAQVLDYASWVRKLTYKEINSIALEYLNIDLSVVFNEYFGESLPEKINTDHKMIIVASELDESSERIVQYLAEEYEIDINVIFFRFFRAGVDELLGRAWLMDPEEVQERAESRKQVPWSGFWFVNVGEGLHRNWDDNRNYSFIGAGQGLKYSSALKRLKVGDRFFAYMKGSGYVGYGEVSKEAVMLKDFFVDSENKYLHQLDLKAPKSKENMDDPELAEWVVGVEWIKVFKREESKTFNGIFANQNVVCKLRQKSTLDFLRREFNLSE